MASSDNVLRGGLTPKHVDIDELLRVLEFADGPVVPVRPWRLDEDEEVWDAPAREFRLSRIHVRARPVRRDVSGPEILLCVDGAVRVDGADRSGAVPLARGAAAFIPGSSTRYELDGAGTVFRAAVGAL
jgi:mannose-6-phosphate isomerase